MLLIEKSTGVELSTAHPEDPICSDKRKQIVSNPPQLKITYFRHIMY